MTVLHMNCLDGLRVLGDNSVDSIVTDPPYGLRFMGKKWDYDVPSVKLWAECLRVLKPGGHLLAFAGTRTQHRMAVRIEDAGFEIRDMIAWAYGSGFPKSLDVSKAIDKQRTEDVGPVRVICRAIRAAMDALGLKSHHLVDAFDGCHPRLIDHWAARDTDSQPSLPTWEQWEKLRGLLCMDGRHDAEVWRLNGRKGQPGDTWQNAEVIGIQENAMSGWRADGTGLSANFIDREIKAANSDAARQWQGWGTALKPALEPITVARKPLAGTVAANVLQHGTGALNIDGCRVPAEKATGWGGGGSALYEGGLSRDGGEARLQDSGRWPANLIHDGSEEVLAGFPESKAGGSVSGKEPSKTGTANCYGEYERVPFAGHNDTGSAARFFYCAKTSKSDRGDGNNHPTVKPTDLMRYLCRLVTPPGGLVLDPFTGSGSTGKAAKLEGFQFIGFELSEEYVAIARARIDEAVKYPYDRSHYDQTN